MIDPFRTNLLDLIVPKLNEIKTKTFIHQMNPFTLKFNNPELETEFRRHHQDKVLPYQRTFLLVLFIMSIVWYMISRYLGIKVDTSIAASLQITLILLILVSIIAIALSYFKSLHIHQELGTFFICLLIGSILLIFFNSLPYKEFITYSYGVVILFIFAFLILAAMNVVLGFSISIVLIALYSLIMVNKISVYNLNNLVPIFDIVTAFVFGMVGAYAFEKISRQEFISTQAIENHKKMLEDLSVNLSKYISPNLYNSIFSGEKDVRIESTRKKLTVFFSDIQGFTELTDSVESETLTLVLNSYLNEMAKIALHYGGTIDKFIGDAIMLFFGDPQSKGEIEDALACVRMALDMQKRIRVLSQSWQKSGIPKVIRVRIGIHSGFCTVGNFGSDSRLEYTIIGGAVNLAKRLESAANVDKILISNDTYELIKDHIFCRKRNKIQIKGIAYPVQTYEVIGPMEQVKKDEFTKKFVGFSLNVDYYKVDQKQAKVALKEALARL